MERISSMIVGRMVLADLIDDSEVDLYHYGVQVLLEKSISYALILYLAITTHCFIQVLVFIIAFSLIRKYSGGIHCERYGTCLIASLSVSFSGVLIYPFIEKIYPIYQGGVIMSMIIITLIGAINNPNIDWSEYEYYRAKRLSRLSLVFEATLLLLLSLLQIHNRIRFSISYGIVVCAVSMLLEIKKKGGKANEGN